MVFHFPQYHPANSHGVPSHQCPVRYHHVSCELTSCYMPCITRPKKLHTMRYHEDTMAKKLCLSAMLGMPCLLAIQGTLHLLALLGALHLLALTAAGLRQMALTTAKWHRQVGTGLLRKIPWYCWK